MNNIEYAYNWIRIVHEEKPVSGFIVCVNVKKNIGRKGIN